MKIDEYSLMCLDYSSLSGMSRRPFWRRLPFDQVAIDHMVFPDITIASRKQLKRRVIELSNRSLPKQYPLWQMRLIQAPYLKQVLLMIRVHQSLCDGVGLMSLLVGCIADSAPPSTTTFIRTCHGTMTASSCEYISSLALSLSSPPPLSLLHLSSLCTPTPVRIIAWSACHLSPHVGSKIYNEIHLLSSRLFYLSRETCQVLASHCECRLTQLDSTFSFTCLMLVCFLPDACNSCVVWVVSIEKKRDERAVDMSLMNRVFHLHGKNQCSPNSESVVGRSRSISVTRMKPDAIIYYICTLHYKERWRERESTCVSHWHYFEREGWKHCSCRVLDSLAKYLLYSWTVHPQFTHTFLFLLGRMLAPKFFLCTLLPSLRLWLRCLMIHLLPPSP